MKRFILTSIVVGLVSTNGALAISPEARMAISREFGEQQLRNLVLVGGASTVAEPTQWNVYGFDPHRETEMVKISVLNANGGWRATSGAVGSLHLLPKRKLDFQRLKFDAMRARGVAFQAATLAQTSFVRVEYQLAANEQTGAPEWGLGLQDSKGTEIGFCVVSGETGAVTFQDWTPKNDSNDASISAADRKAEAAARKVKQSARKAWNWTEDAGRKTGSFFRELFR